ncbi:MAG: M20/M25/M40 family metallo-hydrolase [Syntrophobacterales bacterium]|jgi:acetylornithine deacetylase/succinyl-diaminopimelate desuccinylase-like protein|nr:M20/M25/M40 family metallo-hydrolase [Syntrophobacterales bacterium]
MMEDKDRAVSLLRQFLRIDTTNPPGNEEEAVLFLEGILSEAGIRSEIYKAAPRRANLMARIKGKKNGKPIVLLSHVDVVPAKAEEWDFDPFGGEIKDGFIYGRGAIDMKSQTICHLLAFMNLLGEGITPEQDILFLATGDEEVGGKFGVEYMVKHVEELRQASFVLSEGGWITKEGGVRHAQISVTEKNLAQFFIRANGTGGHGSRPFKDNANEKIINTAKKIAAHKWPFKSTKTVSTYFNGVFKGFKGDGFVFDNLKDTLKHKKFREFVEDNPVYNALLRNTVTLTVLRGGEKVNVIPTESSAFFDARLLPGENYNQFMKKIGNLAGKEVEVVPISGGSKEPAPSGYNTPYFRSLIKAVSKIDGLLPVLPFITSGATDLRYFRELGSFAYGFFPVVLPREEELRMHGVNERISIAGLLEGMEGMKNIVKELAKIK